MSYHQYVLAKFRSLIHFLLTYRTIFQCFRYKDDVYDRMWFPYNSVDWARLSTSLTVDAEGSNDYQPPPIVINTAAAPINASKSLDFYLDIDDTTLQFYVYMHFAEIQILKANESRLLNISLNGKHWYGPFSPTYLSTSTVFSPSALTGGNYSFSIYKAQSSSLPPILNAIEIYSVKEFLQLQTEQVDGMHNFFLIYHFRQTLPYTTKTIYLSLSLICF